jgi:hypothetical protein
MRSIFLLVHVAAFQILVLSLDFVSRLEQAPETNEIEKRERHARSYASNGCETEHVTTSAAVTAERLPAAKACPHSMYNKLYYYFYLRSYYKLLFHKHNSIQCFTVSKFFFNLNY